MLNYWHIYFNFQHNFKGTFGGVSIFQFPYFFKV